MTDNHGYNEPSRGALDWDIPLNENFRLLDSDVPIVDTDANKSNYTANVNQLFVASDSETIYIGDGSAWTTLADLSNTTPFERTWGVGPMPVGIGANESLKYPIPHPPGATLTLDYWSIRLSDGTTDSNLELAFVDYQGTELDNLPLSSQENQAAPDVSDSQSTGSPETATVQLINNGSTDYTTDSSPSIWIAANVEQS